MTICSVDGCENNSRTRGWCENHYARWRRHGNIDLQTKLTLEERFWSKVDFFSHPNGCWLWTASIADGYGQFSVKRRGRWSPMKAQRAAWILTNGCFPSHLMVDHKTTCPKNCVNPAHLRVVTQKQNQENRDGAQHNSSSGIRGVSWSSNRKKWVAQVKHNGRQINCGRYATIEEAAEAVRLKRLELFTHSDMDRVSL